MMFIKLLVVGFVAVFAQTTSDSSCKYSSYGPNISVFAGDETCGTLGSSCVVDALTCNITDIVSLPNGTFVAPWYYTYNKTATLLFPDFNAFGDHSHSNASMPTLIVGDIPFLIVKDMVLPSSVIRADFSNITKMDFGSITKPFPPSLVALNIYNSSLDIFPITFKWPNVLNITLLGNNLQTIPKNLPASLKNFAIQNNLITDFNYLPANLSLLNLRGNQITSVINNDWRSLDFLAFTNNPLTTIYKLKLSNKLRYFGGSNCPITNFTINNETYNALNKLTASPDGMYGFKMNGNISVDQAACTAISGSVMQLWANKTNYSIFACVAPDTLPKNADSSSNNIGVIIGCVIGGVAVICIILFFVLRKRKNNDQSFYYENPTLGNNTGTGTQGSAGEYSEMGLNVEDLRVHKLDLSDLKVTTKKPLASGAFGEVWLGT
ncbi:hypothetical protein THRCLA_10274, partial [Thraustotheca clavata]